MKLNKQYGLNKVANKMVRQLDKFEQLKELANRSNYPHKLKKLHERLLEEVDLWERKDLSNKLLDLKKDLNFVESQLNEKDLSRGKIDLLAEKYSIGYGKDRSSV
jgi:hypothetical protein